MTPVLQLLGGISVSGLDPLAADRLVAQTKVLGLLAYLSLAPEGRYQRRDKLIGLLWPDFPQENARAALRKAIHVSRKAFGDDDVITGGEEQVLLDRQKVACDATRFLALSESGNVAGALDIYRGEFMPGFSINGCSEFGYWIDDQRNAVSQAASAAAWTLAVNLEAERHLTEAGKRAREAIRYDWRDERVLRRTMKLLARIGDKGGAISVYEDTARRMLKELDVALSDETQRLADAIRKGQPAS
jgi:DNA-binding SARP family transcriptional activator